METSKVDRSGGREPNELLLQEVVAAFRSQKRSGDTALQQLREDDWHVRIDPESNSVAVLVRHLDGNMRSRWTDFLTSDGEKASRDRDAEFEDAEATPEQLLASWERGWETVFGAIEPLTPNDLVRTVTVGGEPSSVAQALLRQLTHYAQHVGQIVLLAKHLTGPSWRTLTVPRRRGSP